MNAHLDHTVALLRLDHFRREAARERRIPRARPAPAPGGVRRRAALRLRRGAVRPAA